jgi:hypothetical protein
MLGCMTDLEFDEFSWHDATVHAVALEPAEDHPGSLLIDLDYIVEWVAPGRPGGAFRFWVAPATLTFDRAWDITLRGSTVGAVNELSIDRIVRSPRPVPSAATGWFTWTVEGHNFTIEFAAGECAQRLRAEPRLVDRQSLTLAERGGISFG